MSGWDTDVEDKIDINYFHATPLSSSILPLNSLKYKAWNFFLLYTPKHVIQFIMADVGIACSSTLIVFEKDKDPNLTKLRVEEMFTCPQINKVSAGLGEGSSIISSSMTMEVKRVGRDTSPIYKIEISADKIKFKANFKFDYSSKPG